MNDPGVAYTGQEIAELQRLARERQKERMVRICDDFLNKRWPPSRGLLIPSAILALVDMLMAARTD